METKNDFVKANDLATRSVRAFYELCNRGRTDDESVSKLAAEFKAEMEGLSWMEQEAAAKDMIDQFFDGLKQEVDKRTSVKADSLIVNKRKTQTAGLKYTPSMIKTLHTKEEINDRIRLMQMYLLCIELIFSAEMQRLAIHVLQLLKEKGLYRHQLKKYANKLKEVTEFLQRRSNMSNKDLVTTQAEIASYKKLWAMDYYEDGGDIINRLSVGFNRTYGMEIKRLRLDCKWMAQQMELKHPDLMSEIFTLQALAQTDIELWQHCQKHIVNYGRGKVQDRCVKGSHSEAMLHAAKSLSDQFIDRQADAPAESAALLRKHITEFHEKLTAEAMFDFFEGQFLALKMDFVEYYFARLRMDMEEGKVSIAAIRDVWFRMGSKENVRQFFKELKRMPLLKDKDADALDLAKSIAASKKKQEAMNSFRRLCVNDERILPPVEPNETWQHRVLRVVARKFKGELPNDVLASLVKAHGTKKAVVEQLQKAGFELKPTLERVKKMKASELKQIA